MNYFVNFIVQFANRIKLEASLHPHSNQQLKSSNLSLQFGQSFWYLSGMEYRWYDRETP